MKSSASFCQIINLTNWASRPIVPSNLKDDFTRALSFSPSFPVPFKTWHVATFVNKTMPVGIEET